ncbi:phage tail protein [Tenacibaculum halocynthiae]|uniref:phage tail protein n=1 Tax=Tenacibaculum halocynthiae TaxID=1254437 RepID=UPI003D64701A
MKQDKETLKTYFETGDKPTQQQFSDLIDSLNNPFIGEIKTVSFYGIPEGWARCEGQILNISEYQDLFSFIGNTYGGNGTSTFALPDLRGRIPLGAGNSAELSNYSTGQKGGEETHVLKENEMPSHSHGTTSSNQYIQLSTDNAINETPQVGNVQALAQFGPGLSATSVKSFGPPTNLVNGQNINTNVTINSSGNNIAHNNLQPYLAINYIIALKGRIPFVNPH